MTDVGQKRTENEDNYLVNEALKLFLVADGMGGHVGGDYASSLAVNTMEEVLWNHASLESSMKAETAVLPDRLIHAARIAGRRIYETGTRDLEFSGMGTTMVGLLVEGTEACVANVGDSRAYLIRSGEIRQVTEDHSLVADGVRNGVITIEEAKTHKMRNIVTRSLGYREDVDVDAFQWVLEDGDTVLLCSDGLSSFVDSEDLLKVVLSNGLHEASKQLVQMACERGGDDNITLVVVHFESIQ